MPLFQQIKSELAIVEVGQLGGVHANERVHGARRR